MSFFAWKPYVPVAKRRENAAKTLAKIQKKSGVIASPVVINGRKIATSFWGQSWCENLERYSDYANRLPRGRTYARNGSVVDLQIKKGEIAAKVAGSSLYTIEIDIVPVATGRWASLAKDCAGSIDSVVELLQGRLAKGVMERVCRQGEGLFPGPKEIKLSCSCPDGAYMCKHVAAVLYGVGARLDQQPELLFVLRGVDAKDMIAKASIQLATPRLKAASSTRVLDDDLSALFGLDLEDDTPVPMPSVAATEPGRRSRIAPAPKKRAIRPKVPIAEPAKTAEHPAARSKRGKSAVEARRRSAGSQSRKRLRKTSTVNR